MNFVFYLEGLNREVTMYSYCESMAHKQVWLSLSDAERDAVVQIELIDCLFDD